MTGFLKEHGFSFIEEGHGHQVWVKVRRGRPVRFVEFDFESGKYLPEAMESTINQSSIIERDRMEWAGLYSRDPGSGN